MKTKLDYIKNIISCVLAVIISIGVVVLLKYIHSDLDRAEKFWKGVSVFGGILCFVSLVMILAQAIRRSL